MIRYKLYFECGHTTITMPMNEGVKEEVKLSLFDSFDGKQGEYKLVDIEELPGDVMFQPILSEDQWAETDLPSFGVYRGYARCREDFPGVEIGIYNPGDIEDPTFMDELNEVA